MIQISARRAISKRMGELLIERGVITTEQLEKALQQQAQKGGYLSQHLISLGFASEVDIANCLSVQYNLGYIPLDNYKIPSYLLETIPLKLIKIFSIVPLDKIGRILTVAMADPLNEGVIEILRQVTDCDIEVLVSTHSELNRTIDKYFSKEIQDMGKYAISEDDLVREGVVESFIKTAGYGGQERRIYQRINVELDMEYFLYGKIFKAKVKNISYVGVYFVSSSFIPVDTNVLSKIHIKDNPLDVAVQVVRVEKIDQDSQVNKDESFCSGYGIAGSFNFLTEDDKNKLVFFLEGKNSP